MLLLIETANRVGRIINNALFIEERSIFGNRKNEEADRGFPFAVDLQLTNQS